MNKYKELQFDIRIIIHAKYEQYELNEVFIEKGFEELYKYVKFFKDEKEYLIKKYDIDKGYLESMIYKTIREMILDSMYRD